MMGRRDGGCLGLAATGYAIKEGDTPQSAIRVDGKRRCGGDARGRMRRTEKSPWCN